MVFKLSKKGHFSQFCADFSKKYKSLQAIYIYAYESSQYTLSENAMVYRGLSHRYKILTIEISKKMLTCWNLAKFLDFKH